MQSDLTVFYMFKKLKENVYKLLLEYSTSMVLFTNSSSSKKSGFQSITNSISLFNWNVGCISTITLQTYKFVKKILYRSFLFNWLKMIYKEFECSYWKCGWTNAYGIATKLLKFSKHIYAIHLLRNSFKSTSFSEW